MYLLKNWEKMFVWKTEVNFPPPLLQCAVHASWWTNFNSIKAEMAERVLFQLSPQDSDELDAYYRNGAKFTG